jgi:hypothetical protein
MVKNVISIGILFANGDMGGKMNKYKVIYKIFDTLQQCHFAYFQSYPYSTHTTYVYY